MRVALCLSSEQTFCYHYKFRAAGKGSRQRRFIIVNISCTEGPSPMHCRSGPGARRYQSRGPIGSAGITAVPQRKDHRKSSVRLAAYVIPSTMDAGSQDCLPNLRKHP